MVKVTLDPKDVHFEHNVMQLRRSKFVSHVEVTVEGRTYVCKDARVLADGRFAYALRLSLGEFRVNMSAISRVTFYLEV